MGEKWDADARPGEKLLSLYSMLLFFRNEMSLSELSRDLNCSKQAVMRMIDQMEAAHFGKLVRTKQGKEAYYHLDRPKTLPNITIDADGLYQLAICRDFFIHLLPAGMRKKVNAVIKQASAFLPEGEELPGNIGQSIIKGRIDYTPQQDVLMALMHCIEKHLVCTITYKPSLQSAKRDFDYAPKRLIAHQDALYLSGWLVSRKIPVTAKHPNPTTLAVHRVRQAAITNISSRHLPEPEDTANSFGMMRQEPFAVRIRFNKAAATYAAEREWSRGQKITKHTDGSITLDITAQSEAECLAWVFSFGDTAEVLAPGWLREAAGAKARAMAAMYGSK
jgi:predicted DNA-binding transcriptional regulator YafY